MNVKGLLVLGLLQPLAAAALAYDDHGAPAAKTEPAPAGLPSAEKQYPYYGNTPDEMIPFRGVEPHYRYWVTRLPFLGPGRDYPDPVGLKSLKVGLLSPASYGPEGARGQRTRKGVLLAFEVRRKMRGAIPANCRSK
jgi:hypothetical protein